MGRLSTAAAQPEDSAESWSAEVSQASSAINETGRSLFVAGVLSASRAFVAAVRIAGDRLVIGGFDPQNAGAAIVVSLTNQADNAADNPALHEIAPTFVALFNERPEAASAIYTQSPNLTAFAVAGLPLPVVYGSGLLKRTPISIPVVAWSPLQATDTLLQTLRQQPLASAVLLANRGFIAWSDEPVIKLARFALSLEESASITINAHALGGAKPLPAGAYESMQSSISGE